MQCSAVGAGSAVQLSAPSAKLHRLDPTLFCHSSFLLQHYNVPKLRPKDTQLSIRPIHDTATSHTFLPSYATCINIDVLLLLRTSLSTPSSLLSTLPASAACYRSFSRLKVAMSSHTRARAVISPTLDLVLSIAEPVIFVYIRCGADNDNNERGERREADLMSQLDARRAESNLPDNLQMSAYRELGSVPAGRPSPVMCEMMRHIEERHQQCSERHDVVVVKSIKDMGGW